MSDIVNAFKQTKGYKKRKNLLSDTQEVAQQPQEQETENQALTASQQQNIALDTSGTKDSDRLAQLEQLAAAETAQNEANKQAAQAAAQAQQKAQESQNRLSEQAQNVYNNAHNDMGWKKYYNEEKQKVRDSAFKNDGFGSWLQDVFNAGWDSRLAESQARNRYSFFASKAKDEGYQAIGKIFLETAEQEREHASRLFKFLEGGELEITASFPAGKIGTTLENLQAAAYGEHEENTDMYPRFAQIAAEEGFDSIAEVLKNIGYAERYHESRFRALIDAIENGTLFKQDKIVMWRCTNCGMWHIGTEAPKVCPACLHPQGYFISEGTISRCDTNEGFCEYAKIDE